MKRNSSINDILKPLGDKPYQAYLSNVLQVADVLEWVLEQVGTAEVWQTSFSISEEFLRRLFFIEKSGRVKRFNLVLDHKATNKTLKLWAFITQVIERTYLADNHSKILLVRSDAGDTVSVVTSQNLTRGKPRFPPLAIQRNDFGDIPDGEETQGHKDNGESSLKLCEV